MILNRTGPHKQELRDRLSILTKRINALSSAIDCFVAAGCPQDDIDTLKEIQDELKTEADIILARLKI